MQIASVLSEAQFAARPVAALGQPARRAPRVVSALALALLPCAAACSGSVSASSDFDPVLHVEWEPNDSEGSANALGLLGPHEPQFVQGDICDPSCDPADGFVFELGGPSWIEFSLECTSGAADFDLAVYDPQAQQWIAFYESPAPHEAGQFFVDGPGQVHLIVSAFVGGGSYELALEAQPAHDASAVEQASAGAARAGQAARGAGVRAYPAQARALEPHAPQLAARGWLLVLDADGVPLAQAQLVESERGLHALDGQRIASND